MVDRIGRVRADRRAVVGAPEARVEHLDRSGEQRAGARRPRRKVTEIDFVQDLVATSKSIVLRLVVVMCC